MSRPGRHTRIQRLLEAQGWVFAGHTGSQHRRYRHPSGAILITAESPSDFHWESMALSQARQAVRIALERQARALVKG